MAVLHNQLNRVTELLRGFRRAVGLVDADQEGVSRLGETLTPVLDIWSLPEHAILREELLGWGQAAAAAGGAGTRSQIQLRNPTGSNRIAVLERVYTNGAVELGWDTTEYATLVTTSGVRDGRSIRNCVCQVRTQNTIPATGVQRGQLNGGFMPWDDPIPFSPGVSVFVRATADNTAVSCGFVWRERTMVPGESVDELK